jgi:hypothetical protein
MGIVGFVVLWNVGGPDITLLAAAMVGLILIAVSVLGGRGTGAAETGPGSADTSG